MSSNLVKAVDSEARSGRKRNLMLKWIGLKCNKYQKIANKYRLKDEKYEEYRIYRNAGIGEKHSRCCCC